MKNFLRVVGVHQKEHLELVQVVLNTCQICRSYKRTLHKPMIKITIATRFNQYVQGDIWFCWDLPFLVGH